MSADCHNVTPVFYIGTSSRRRGRPVDNSGHISAHAQAASGISPECTKPDLRFCVGHIDVTSTDAAPTRSFSFILADMLPPSSRLWRLRFTAAWSFSEGPARIPDLPRPGMQIIEFRVVRTPEFA